MESDLLRGLERFAAIDEPERRALAEAARIRRLRAKEDISVEGEAPREVHILISGWACEYKMLADGRRQIVSLLLPGDAWNLLMFDSERMDCSIAGLTPTVVARISQWRMEQVMTEFPAVRQMMLRNLLFSAVLQREMTVSLGRRDGLERVAHFLCEIQLRLASVGLATEDQCAFPMTQTDLGDALGFTAVHANRLLQELRRSQHITLRNRTLTILDKDALRETAQFSCRYLDIAMNRVEHAVPAAKWAMAG